MIALLITLFGGFGASARFMSDGFIRSVLGRMFPWATLIINVVGSFILGCVTGYIVHHHGSMDIKLVIGTGFCGGFTTFSTACFEAVRLVEEKRYLAFWMQIMGNLLFSVLAVAIGISIIN